MNEKLRKFEELCSRAVEVSHKTLRTLLDDNGGTEYGKEHRIGEIKDIQEYRRLPLTNYVNYAERIERMKQGEENVLTAYDKRRQKVDERKK